MDLNELTPEEIVELGYMLNEEMAKEASENYGDGIDLNDLSPEEIVELGYLLNDEMEKEASEYHDGGFDLNELDVEDFIELAAELEYEMEKEASMAKLKAGYGRAKKSAMEGYGRAKSAIMGAPGKIKSHYSGRYSRAMSAANEMAGKSPAGRTFYGRKKYTQNAPTKMQLGKALGREFSPEISAAGATVSLGALMAARRGE